MKIKREIRLITIFVLALMLIVFAANASADGLMLTKQEMLGKLLFFDKNLSEPKGQSCAFCHGPEVGFTGPDHLVNATIAVYPGAVPNRFGNRKPPSAAYGGNSPVLHYTTMWIGGMFWDGRATGWTLGDPLAEQAKGPFLNPLEQNMPSAKAVVDRVLASFYRSLFIEVCGKAYDVTKYYTCIARSIAGYERSKEVSAFTSKYDSYLKGMAKLTDKERLGLELFEGKAKCSNCHISRPDPITKRPPLFTDYTYDNLGVPSNPMNPFYYEPEWNPLGTSWIDYGLGDFLKSAGYPYMTEQGKMKVPTLRNVDKRPYPMFVKSFGHNGFFKSLEAIVHFYNTRDTLPACAPNVIPVLTANLPDCWPEPEVGMNVNTAEIGDLGLTAEEEAAVVAFLKTLSDGYTKSYY
jgi:cytochrome c peroxidase